jgi:hypothetical protein
MLCTGSPTHGHSERTRRRQTTDTLRNTRVRSLPSHAPENRASPGDGSARSSDSPQRLRGPFLLRWRARPPAASQIDRLVLQMAAKSDDWQAKAGLATTAPLHCWAIVTAASASDCETRSLRWSSANQRKPKMSHPRVQADSTGERRGAAVSFATKEDAIAYIVSLAPRGTSLFDNPVVESVNRAASQSAQSTAN